MEYYSALKKNETHNLKKNDELIIIVEVTQFQKRKILHIFPHVNSGL